jgi:putative metallopeptidase DUF4344
MKRTAILVTVVGALAASFGASATPVFAQQGKVQIVYEEPKNPKFQPIYESLRQRKVLETLQNFLSPLKLERTLTIKTAECGGSPFAPYQKGGLATLCYEYVDLIESVLPGEKGKGISAPKDYRRLFKNLGRIGPVLVTRNMAAEGPFVEQALHETALGVFDVLDVPIWGRRDDAADYLAAYLMVQFGSDVARKTVYGTAYFLNQLDLLNRSNVMDTDYLSAVHPTIRQRYYNVLCIALGNDPIEFSTFIPDKMKVSDVSLPYGRLASCTGQLETARHETGTDYGKVGAAFAELILPHVDLDLLKKVQNTKWLPEDE